MLTAVPANEASRPLVELRAAGAAYGRRPALEAITFAARAGEMVFITGRSGAGKTSLLRLIHGELRVSTGSAWVAGIALHRSRRPGRVRRRVGVVFQDYALIASMTALENVEFAYRAGHLWDTRGRARERARAVIAHVGLEPRAGAFPAELSGGEQQRVAIARALVGDPDILLADEPTGNLDRENAVDVLDLLEGAARRGALVVVATHDPSLVTAGRRLLRMEGGRLREGLLRVHAS